jgi:hypothetical protein
MVNIFELKTTPANHGAGSGIRDPAPNAVVMDEMLTYAQGDGIMTSEEFGNARKHFNTKRPGGQGTSSQGTAYNQSTGEKEKATGGLSVMDFATGSVEFALLFKVFGSNHGKGSTSMKTEDLRSVFLHGKYPKDFKPHPVGLVGMFSGIYEQLGCCAVLKVMVGFVPALTIGPIGCCSGGKSAIAQVCDVPLSLKHIDPLLYFCASNEIMAICIAICWLMTTVFNPSSYYDNPIRDRVGYNNFCWGFDTAPARYFATPCFAILAWLGIQFAISDQQRAILTKEKTGKTAFALSQRGNQAFALSSVLLPMLTVVTPDISVWWHTNIFLVHVIGRWLCYLANFFEASHVTLGQKWFFAIHTLASIGFPACLAINYIAYDALSPDERQGFVPVVPPYIGQPIDLLWFITIMLTTKFLPQAARIDIDAKMSTIRSSRLKTVTPKTTAGEAEVGLLRRSPPVAAAAATGTNSGSFL